MFFRVKDLFYVFFGFIGFLWWCFLRRQWFGNGFSTNFGGLDCADFAWIINQVLLFKVDFGPFLAFQ